MKLIEDTQNDIEKLKTSLKTANDRLIDLKKMLVSMDEESKRNQVWLENKIASMHETMTAHMLQTNIIAASLKNNKTNFPELNLENITL